MPASLTRTCPTCDREKPLDDFRALDMLGRSRTPKHCRACREADPVLAANFERQIDKRPRDRALIERYSARSADEVARIQRDAYPDGVKVCPEGYGCGRSLPLAAFRHHSAHYDGLRSTCRECNADAAALQLA